MQFKTQQCKYYETKRHAKSLKREKNQYRYIYIFLLQEFIPLVRYSNLRRSQIMVNENLVNVETPVGN